MLIPLGFLAASGVSAGSFDLLETQVLGSSTASVTFSSLSTYASTYQHFQLRVAARTDRASYVDTVAIRFNSDTANNYSNHYLAGNGSTAFSGVETSQNKMLSIRVTAANAGTSVFGGGTVDLLDVFETTKNKTARSLSGYTSGSGSEVYLFSGAWYSTTAVSSMTLIPNIGTNFVTGSRFSLYGIKAA
jgi:hypothetical protein